MRTVARILTPLLLTIGLLAGAQVAASADPEALPTEPAPYNTMSRAKLIATLVERDAQVDQLLGDVTDWRGRAYDGWNRIARLEEALVAERHRAAVAEQQVTDLTGRVDYYTDLARTWETSYRTTYRQLVRAEARADRLARRLAIVKAGR